ncbi:hypothetical protein EO763_23505 (plasmid) [Pectobacterium odoriferum]|uniref:hypothetical protein n=1 Tax=Pectobacterium odoriferum TaxID=78398 RepID=UPI001373C91B|nr:hypothetical protein [Pectobacterium odoriferum]QHP82858.1 hypothetical protein EO763_23505 [Pectobacterium odoriferum]
MSQKGIEDSVASIFKLQLQLWCISQNKDDLIFDMNGSDRNVNADAMFSVCDRFFLVEMKSKESNIKDEAAKPAVCVLCTGIKDSEQIRHLHRACHYIMWGMENTFKSQIETFYTIYEDSVCRPDILPHCKAVTKPTQREVLSGSGLALRTVNGEAGLIGTYFFPYLAWLLGSRNGPTSPFTPTEPVPIALIGNSANRQVVGKVFANYQELINWGEPAVHNQLKKNPPPARP